MVTMTLDEVRKRKHTKSEKERLIRLASLPDEQIDTSDLPDLSAFADGVRARFYRSATQSATIRVGRQNRRS
jgi:hypothetical protein